MKTKKNNHRILLTQFRKQKKLSQQEVANILKDHFGIKITRQAISNIERGKKNPSIEVLLALAKIYEINIGDIGKILQKGD